MEATGIEAEIERREIAADSPAAKRVAQNHCTGRPTASILACGQYALARVSSMESTRAKAQAKPDNWGLFRR